MFKRAGTLLFALLAAALGVAALADVYLHGKLTILDPSLLGGLAVVGIGFLLFGIVSQRDRATDLEGRTDRLTALTGELENFISALEAANQRLHASEARYKGLVDSQGDAILRRTSDGRLTYANDSFFRMFGVKPTDVIGQAFRPELHPESPPPVFGRFAGRETGRERVSYDQHVKTVAGYRWIAWEDYAIRDSDGRLIEIQSVGRDITERKVLEAALTDARDKAQEANKAKSHFLATMSHEIRTPMNGVLGMARLLQETQLMPDQRTYSEAIVQSGVSLLTLIEDILDFSKIESGTLVLHNELVEVRPLIESVTELLAPRAHAKKIDIATTVAADVPAVVEADPIRLRQILTNLLGNAVKFTEDGGVLVSATVERGPGAAPVLSIAVRDTGVGVPPEKQAQIFEEFVQADSTHARRFEGTGLGLAISRRIVGAMGGKIGMMGAEDRGSVFWFTLPLASLSPSNPPVLSAAAKKLKGKRAAVISTSPLLRAAIKLQLAAAGCDPVDVRSIETLTRLKAKVDVAVLDAGIADDEPLPNVDALGVPVVALLPTHQRAELARLPEKGISGYLMKPVRQASLEQTLANAISGEKIQAASPRPSAKRVAGKALSILLAEDNPVNALLARELLRRRGHTVSEVTTGEAAVAACAAKRFDLIITDIHMPGLDGIEATRRIRAAEKAAGAARTPILALSADALETGKHACIDAGMDGFLAKPIDPDQLDELLAGLTPDRVAAE